MNSSSRMLKVGDRVSHIWPEEFNKGDGTVREVHQGKYYVTWDKIKHLLDHPDNEESFTSRVLVRVLPL